MSYREIYFVKPSPTAEFRSFKQPCRALNPLRLADGPQPHAVKLALARNVIGIDIVMLLQGAEQVELEGYAGMARRHHRMGHELAGLGGAVMAIEANPRAHLRIFEQIGRAHV